MFISENLPLSNNFPNKPSTVPEKIEIPEIILAAKNKLQKIPNSKIDYVSIAETSMLEPIYKRKEGQKIVILVAVFVENVRLIDNLMLNE